MRIKASAITNLTDARYFAAKEVDYLGFNLEENTDGYLDPMYMRAIREWVQGPKIVGEFDRSPAAVVREAAAFFSLDAVQVTQLDALPDLQGLEVILRVPGASDPAALEELLRYAAPSVAFFLLDFAAPEAAVALQGQHAASWKHLFAEFPVLLDADVPADTLLYLLDTLRPAGLALRGGAEERVGVKSFEEVDAVFEGLE